MTQEQIMALSGGMRIRIASRMFDEYRAGIIATLPKDLPPDEFRRRLYERIYGEKAPF